MKRCSDPLLTIIIYFWELGLQICMVVVRLVVIFLENHSVEHGMLVWLFKLGISGTRSTLFCAMRIAPFVGPFFLYLAFFFFFFSFSLFPISFVKEKLSKLFMLAKGCPWGLSLKWMGFGMSLAPKAVVSSTPVLLLLLGLNMFDWNAVNKFYHGWRNFFLSFFQFSYFAPKMAIVQKIWANLGQDK